MQKRRKRIVITLCVIASSIVTYFAFGLIGVSVAADAFINKRNGDLQDDIYCVQKTRKDYPLLDNREEILFSLR